ncbi:ATP adenylyltransferase [Exidia glandulosa HHB12029]|uniref:ATP adenylyltransferase n=1 Tax=Exidia glandulosa HHB12029 TaxID=1314781 RepID=A0A165BD68_EXIGL|nr:ATP adenylyltransferase [Exidia glandulosa HHB12029]
MATKKAIAQIVGRVPEVYDNAVAGGSVFYFPSTVETHAEAGTEFEIRLCPALLKKPILPTPHFESDQPPSEHRPAHKDPFAPPFDPSLVVGELQDEEIEADHVFLLNKFSVVAHHFLMVTKEYESQSAPLTPGDLTHAYMTLVAARNAGKPMFAFYNCGDRSGASQPHKHLQFLPLSPEGAPIERLARIHVVEDISKPFSIQALPYANYVLRLPPTTSSQTRGELADTLVFAYLALLDLVVSAARHQPAERQELAPGPPSYNVLLTLEHIHLIPRAQETHTLKGTGEKLSINSLGFAGMLLVKCDEEMQAVKSAGVCSILQDVGMLPVNIPSTTLNESDE